MQYGVSYFFVAWCCFSSVKLSLLSRTHAPYPTHDMVNSSPIRKAELLAWTIIKLIDITKDACIV